MERAEAPPVCPHPAQLHVAPHEIHDVRGREHLLKRFFRDSSHTPSVSFDDTNSVSKLSQKVSQENRHPAYRLPRLFFPLPTC